jgi:hypothetical protein
VSTPELPELPPVDDGHVAGRKSGHPQVMEVLFPEDANTPDRGSRRCMRADCQHTVSQHADNQTGYRRCLIPDCPCHHLLEDPGD